jgi:hypothetical protein
MGLAVWMPADHGQLPWCGDVCDARARSEQSEALATLTRVATSLAMAPLMPLPPLTNVLEAAYPSPSTAMRSRDKVPV